MTLTGAPFQGVAAAATGMVKPIWTQQIMDSWGVQTHANYPDSVYSSHVEVLSLLSDLGVRNIRDRLALNSPEALEFFAAAKANGIKLHAVCGALGQTSSTDRADMRAYIEDPANAGLFDSLEGYNEPNDAGRPAGWATQTINHQQWLKSVADRNGLPACSPALRDLGGLEADYAALSGIADYVDVINLHRYPAGVSPSQLIDDRSA